MSNMSKNIPKTQASLWVQRFEPLIPPGGLVLDLACGGGRNAMYLASLGHRVLALDRDISNLPNNKNITGIQEDLEDGSPWPLKGRQFNGIVVCNYLFRPLFPTLISSLADDSVLIYETFASGNEQLGNPRREEFLLRPGELLEAFGKSLEVVAYEYGTVETPKPAVIERIVAARLKTAIRPQLPLIIPKW